MDELNVDEVNGAAQEAGRGQGLDWTRSDTFDTGNFLKLTFQTSIVKLVTSRFSIIAKEAKVYIKQNGLSRCRTNHNLDVRVNYLRCSIPGCPFHCRLLENLVHNDMIPHFEIETAPGHDHNHQVEVFRERGLSSAQKVVIQLYIDRGQAAPKKVKIS